jgi:hypothetical protein
MESSALVDVGVVCEDGQSRHCRLILALFLPVLQRLGKVQGESYTVTYMWRNFGYFSDRQTFFLGEFCENIPYYAAYPTVGRSRFLDFQYRYPTTEFGLAKEFYFNFN